MLAKEWIGRAPIERRETTLHLTCLTPEMREQTCAYWFTIKTFGLTPYTAFRTFAALSRWFADRRLPLPDNMPALGERAHFQIAGGIVDVMHLDPATYAAIKGRETWRYNNGVMRPAKFDADGRKHTMNPNVPQPEIDWRVGTAAEDRGE